MTKTLIKPGNALAAARALATEKLKSEFEGIRVKMSNENLRESLPHVSSGSVIVDYLIGGLKNRAGVASCPGFPRGRVTQIWGHEGSGKTSLALSTAAAVCKAGGSVLYVDWENDIVPDYAMALGVPVTDENRFELLQPENLEDGIKYAMIYAAAGVDLIVFDSVGAAVPRRLASREGHDVAEQGKVGEAQAVWSQELPNLKRLIARAGAAVIGISQTRSEIGMMGYGPKKDKPQGGNAWKFFASVRLELRRDIYETTKEMDPITHKVADKITGVIIKVKTVKCKLSRTQGWEEKYYLKIGQGVDNIRSILEIAISHGLIKKGGAGWITWVKPDGVTVKVQGIDKLRQHMVDHPVEYKALEESTLLLIGAGATSGPVGGQDDPDERDDDDGVQDGDAQGEEGSDRLLAEIRAKMDRDDAED